jgi:hypothetical protein
MYLQPYSRNLTGSERNLHRFRFQSLSTNWWWDVLQERQRLPLHMIECTPNSIWLMWPETGAGCHRGEVGQEIRAGRYEYRLGASPPRTRSYSVGLYEDPMYLPHRDDARIEPKPTGNNWAKQDNLCRAAGQPQSNPYWGKTLVFKGPMQSVIGHRRYRLDNSRQYSICDRLGSIPRLKGRMFWSGAAVWSQAEIDKHNKDRAQYQDWLGTVVKVPVHKPPVRMKPAPTPRGPDYQSAEDQYIWQDIVSPKHSLVSVRNEKGILEWHCGLRSWTDAELNSILATRRSEWDQILQRRGAA